VIFYPVKRHSPLTFAILGLLLCAPGCGDGNETDPASSAANSAETRQPAVAPEVISSLEERGVTVTVSGDGSITGVRLTETDVSDELLNDVLTHKTLRNFAAPQTSFSDEQVELLVASELPLASVDLRDCPISDTGLTLLGGLRSLKALKLSGKSGSTIVTDAGFTAFEKHPTLKALAADGLWIGSAAITSLVSVPTLEELYLADTLVDDGALAMIASLPNIKKLRLARSQISDDGLAALADSKTLVELDLSENTQFTDSCCQSLGQITSLEKLNLWRVPVTSTGILKLRDLTNLLWLNLDNTALSDSGLPALAEMKKLKFLHLGSTQITDAGLPSLSHLTSLDDLKLTRTAVTEDAAAELQQQLTDTDIQLVYIEGQ